MFPCSERQVVIENISNSLISLNSNVKEKMRLFCVLLILLFKKILPLKILATYSLRRRCTALRDLIYFTSICISLIEKTILSKPALLKTISDVLFDRIMIEFDNYIRYCDDQRKSMTTE